MKIAIVIPNWNGEEYLSACLESLSAQTIPANILVVDNGSVDGSLAIIKENYPAVEVVALPRNYGFAGGVNRGIARALEQGAEYVALFNNDAVAYKDWLEHLVKVLDRNDDVGVATGKLLNAKGDSLDSTGEQYSSWGLPFARGRGEPANDKYDEDVYVFGATGGASLYRAKMLRQIGLFDEDFFAYYEDVDLSFRAQLAGWKILYVPGAAAYHNIGGTSGRIKGFTTYHSLKNLPLLLWKNVPWALMPIIWPRLVLVYILFLLSALARGQIWPVIKGFVMGIILLPKKLIQRRGIQKYRTADNDYIRSMIWWDLPPKADKLRHFRSRWYSLIRKEK